MLKSSKEFRKIKRKNKLNLVKQLQEQLVGQQTLVAKINLQEEQQQKRKELKNDYGNNT